MRKNIILIALLLVNGLLYGQKEILIVGDSWAETIWRFRALDTVLQENGFPSGLTEGGEGSGKEGNLTAIGGSRAEQWATNHMDWQLRIKSIISETPSISIIHLIIGGNDLLKIVSKNNIMETSPELREHQLNIIKNNIQTIVDFCLSLKPDIKVLICDYDYLNIDNAKKVYGWDFGGMSQRQLNEVFFAEGLKKKEIADSTDRCFYIENWGVLNTFYNDDIDSNNNLNASMPAKADVGDGIHPNVKAHEVMLQRAVDLFYKKFLQKKF